MKPNAGRRAGRSLLHAFWIGLSVATPVAALVGWYLLGLDNSNYRMRDRWDRWLILGSALLVIVLHGVVLVMLITESRRDARLKKEPPLN